MWVGIVCVLGLQSKIIEEVVKSGVIEEAMKEMMKGVQTMRMVQVMGLERIVLNEGGRTLGREIHSAR